MHVWPVCQLFWQELDGWMGLVVLTASDDVWIMELENVEEDGKFLDYENQDLFSLLLSEFSTL